MTLTLKDISLFKTIFHPNFKISDFTPELFYNLTNLETNYKYADLLILLKYTHKMKNDANFLKLVAANNGGKDKVNDALLILESLTHAIPSIHSYLMTGDFNSVDGAITKFADKDDENTTISKRFHYAFSSLNAIARQPNHVKLQNKEEVAGKMYRLIKLNLPLAMNECLNMCATTSLYDQKFAKELLKEKKDATTKYDLFMKQKRAEIAKNVVQYDNFFNFISIAAENRDHQWLAPRLHKFEVCTRGFIKKIDVNGNVKWTEFYNNFTQRYSAEKPTAGLFDDALNGNGATYAAQFPNPIFRNNQFSHFNQIPNPNGSDAYIGAGKCGAANLTAYLKAKGFNVRTRGTGSNVEYKVEDLIMNSWYVTDKNEKIELIKKNAGFWIASIMRTAENYEKWVKSDENDLIKLPTINGYLKQIVSTECVGTRDFCRMLKNFYISENDIEVKTTIETAILTLRETVRTEIGKYMGKINQTDLDAPVKKWAKQTYAEMMNDDIQPQAILQETNKIEEVKTNAFKYKNALAMVNLDFSHVEKKETIARRYNELKAQRDTLANSFFAKRHANKIHELETQMQLTVSSSINMLEQIYDTSGSTLPNGSKPILTTPGSMPHALEKIMEDRRLINSTIPQGPADESAILALTISKASEGAHKDSTTDLYESNRANAFATHKKIAKNTYQRQINQESE